MANPTRVLLVSGEVAPFAKHSDVADLLRMLPEKLQETNSYEIRIMMPRYGTISERRNRLHEVIRLSGTDVSMGASREALKVKVASIPGIRLQVYFMDNNRFFKRKGIYGDKSGKRFEDNPARALFFGRAALQTVRNLGWTPDVVHAFGWMSSLVPFLVRTELANDPHFESAKVIYTPNDLDIADRFVDADVEALGLSHDDRLIGQDFNSVGVTFADTAIYPPNVQPVPGISGGQFSNEPDEIVEQAVALYSPSVNVIAA